MIITIIIPSRGRAKLCTRAIDSVLLSFSKVNIAYEIIVCVDGWSTEYETLEACFHTVDEVDFYDVGNTGNGSITRNYGIRHAKGDWLIFLDDDDEMLLDRASNLIAFINKIEARTHVILSPVELVFSDGEKKLSNELKYFDFDENISQFGRWQINGVCVSKYVVRSVRFDERLTKWQDTKFVFDVTRLFGTVVLEDPAALWHQNSIRSVMNNKDLAGRRRDLWSFSILFLDLVRKRELRFTAYMKYLSRFILVLFRCLILIGPRESAKIVYAAFKS